MLTATTTMTTSSGVWYIPLLEQLSNLHGVGQ